MAFDLGDSNVTTTSGIDLTGTGTLPAMRSATATTTSPTTLSMAVIRMEATAATDLTLHRITRRYW